MKNIKLKSRLMGFTLIELLVVISIMGVLATIIMVNYMHTQALSRDSRRKGDIALIYTAAKIYYDQKNTFAVPFSHKNDPNDPYTSIWPSNSGCGGDADGFFNAEGPASDAVACDGQYYDLVTKQRTTTSTGNTPLGYPHSIDNSMISQGLLDKPIKDPKTGWSDYMYYPNSTDTDVYAKMEVTTNDNIYTGEPDNPNQNSSDPYKGMYTSYGVNYVFNKGSLSK